MTINTPETYMLRVPLFPPADNASCEGHKECLTSTCAMLAAFHGRTSTVDDYERRRIPFGSATDPLAHVQALRSLDLLAMFHQDWGGARLIREIRQGRPVAVGWRHHGLVTAPMGFAHWSVVTGVVPGGFLMNDPHGEADLVRGGYVSMEVAHSGVYSARNWLPRWDTGGPARASGVYVGRGWVIAAGPRSGRRRTSRTAEVRG